jgi:hypothetical protein
MKAITEKHVVGIELSHEEAVRLYLEIDAQIGVAFGSREADHPGCEALYALYDALNQGGAGR